MSEVTKNNLIKAVAYIAGCAAIGYAIKVTKSAKPLWALLLLSAPNFVSGAAKAAEAVTDVTEDPDNDEETEDEQETE